MELGTHAPVAALAAPVSESEQALVQQLWAKIPDSSLIVGDRLFGTARTLWQAQQAWIERDIAFLVRIRDNINSEVQQRLADGSALVQIPVEDGGITYHLQVREIRAHAVGRDGKRFTLRLWTTLIDSKRFPAAALARHYAGRWEHELYYRELKLDVRNSPVLASYTVETALQEIAALVLASAVIARLRVESATHLKVPPTRLSFFKLMLETQGLWQAFAMFGDMLTAGQRAHAFAQYLESVRHTALLKERRNRSCPRVLRQPVSGWPRKTDQPSHTGDIDINVVRI